MKYAASRNASRSGVATTRKAVLGAASTAYVCSARSRKPPNIVSRAATNVCTSLSSWPPTILDSTPEMVFSPADITFR